ncbi:MULTISPECIES: penicillin-binding protein 2 [unclassified Streptomyces]|uniref:penicillin-binding protein 2 n=1 Tax=unclassified Streptomyces TaxID=2593676 RepID=UPI00225509A9|nr:MULTISPECIES: penicillin-binding protein 2 [unclassified Streptomyces]MCX4990947.1 penicillin-binding protein 2 [Streptomyces sp. NBC_00568]MCX5003822.1 penicillin-binding protein 2 [Streptomyces sp. NBC_00638]
MTNIPETGRTPRVQIRLVVIQILVLSLLGTLGGRLWYLQIRNGDEYAKEASGNHVQQVVQPAVRGSILDARGVPIADNETRLVVSASRTDLLKMPDDGKAVLTKLAGVLGMKPDDVIQKVRLCDAKTPQPCWNGSPYQPIPITDEATARQALQIRERSEDFPGITAEPEAMRRYAAPGKANTAQVLGYLSPVTDDEITKAKDTDSPYLRSDQVGRSGLEREYDKALRGKAGVTRYEVDNLGRVIGKAKSDKAEPGANLVTSIDSRIQRIAEYELNDAMKVARTQFDKNTNENYKADSGAVVVMETKTGRVVAMASNPSYDPNAWVGGISGKDYTKLTGKKSNYPLLNRAIQGQSAPGSIFKVIPTAAAINAGYSFDGPYQCASSYSIGGQVFKNFESKGHGPISLGRALEVSCDTVFYSLAHEQWKKDGGIKPKKNAKDWFYKTAHQFGLGQETGIDLPNEVTGRVPDRQWKQDYWKANKDAWCKYGKKGGSYAQQIAYENCLEGNRMRAGDSVNYSIGQGDTLVTPIQMATIYAAISNGGTLYEPTVGKAIVSADGKSVQQIAPKSNGKLPMSRKTRDEIDGALAGVATRGTAAWRFGGWPQDKIPMHAKTGTAEVYGKQTTSWFATYTKDYSVVMTISQGGTGSGASGPAVRKIYNALYGISDEGVIDKKKAMLPTPQKGLPKIQTDGTIDAPAVSKDPVKDQKASEAPKDGVTDQDLPAGTTASPTDRNRNTRRRTARPRKRRGKRILT